MTKIFVFDTNILISANLLPGSINRVAYDKAITIGMTVYSDVTLTEFKETLRRPKFDKYISKERRLQEITGFIKFGQHIDVSTKVDICRDTKDNKFLELAIDSGASCIITGDKDLLVLHPFENIPIVTAVDFLKLF